MTLGPAAGGQRIAPLSDDELDDDTRALLESVGDLERLNIFRTLVRNGRMFKRFVPFGTVILHGKLPVRDREILVLRTAHRSGCAYEWFQHRRIAADAGVTEDDITRIQQDGDPSGLDPFESALVRSIDDLFDHQCIQDETWATLSEHYDDRALVELIMVAAHFFSLALTLNSIGVQPET